MCGVCTMKTDSAKKSAKPPALGSLNVAVPELDLTTENSVIVNNVMIKVTHTWMIPKLYMKTMIMKLAQKMNN